MGRVGKGSAYKGCMHSIDKCTVGCMYNINSSNPNNVRGSGCAGMSSTDIKALRQSAVMSALMFSTVV